jgi:hypothetical protein
MKKESFDAKIYPEAIREKFGDDYMADEHTFRMGIDKRFTVHFAERFKDLVVLETCTGAGFSTLSLANTAKHVYTVEINPSIQEQAICNIRRAGLSSKVTFRWGSILEQSILDNLPSVDAAFIDPDWAVSGPDHVYRFLNSNTQPPADALLMKILERTKNVALILPPLTDVQELSDIPEHERERLCLGGRHELFCLYFGNLRRTAGETEFPVKT